MSATPTMTKQTSRWGSLLQGAVAGLESRLDTILAEETTLAARNGKAAEQSKLSAPDDGSALSRNSSLKRLGSRPQETSSLRSSSKTLAPDKSPGTPASEGRASLDSAASEPAASIGMYTTQLKVVNGEVPMDETHEAMLSREKISFPSVWIASDVCSRPSLDRISFAGDTYNDEAAPSTINGTQEAGASMTQAFDVSGYPVPQTQEELGEVEFQHQEDIHAYLERIDALQAKLQYLAREGANSARQAAADAPKESAEQKLAAKDEQIALLLEEGQKLSKAEVTHAATIRKLRSRITEAGKNYADVKSKLHTAREVSAELWERVGRLETLQKDAFAKSARLSVLEKEIKDLKDERVASKERIEMLLGQSNNATKKAEQDELQAVTQALAIERELVKSLRDDISNATIEKKLSEERVRAELRGAREELERNRERNKAAEMGLRNELSALESRLELFRARTEEASSGIIGDSQAKLMRQIETLQSQYSLASENWQGIESSFQSRVSALEKERDDAIRGESESRKRARELSNASRRLQQQVDDTSQKYQMLESELVECKEHADVLQNRVFEAENTLIDARDNFQQESQAWEANFATRIEEEKLKWRQEAAQFVVSEAPLLKALSPATSNRKFSAHEIPSFSVRKNFGRYSSTDLSISNVERPYIRQRPSLVWRSSEVASPIGHDSGRSTPFVNGYVPETPSIHTTDQEEYFGNGSSPHRTINDMMSISTVGAGPSVQIVERMSAAVRRLESEKAAFKDELARLTAQREEARCEVVSLMGEVESKRAADARIEKLERDNSAIAQRYQTTLEMLGEKSERVDELTADVADLKKIYRELVENTMK